MTKEFADFISIRAKIDRYEVVYIGNIFDDTETINRESTKKRKKKHIALEFKKE